MPITHQPVRNPMRNLFLPVAAVLVVYAVLSTLTPSRDHVVSQAHAATPLLTEAPAAPAQEGFSPVALPPIQESASASSGCNCDNCDCTNCDCANCKCSVATRTPVRTVVRTVAAPVRAVVSGGYGSGGGYDYATYSNGGYGSGGGYAYSAYGDGGYGSGGGGYDYSAYSNGGYGSGGDDYSGVASTTVRRGLFGRQIVRTSNRPRLFSGGVFRGVSSGYGSSSYCASCQ